MNKRPGLSNRAPARRLRRSAVKNIVRFPAKKSGGSKTILVESLLEAAYCLHLEFSEEVIEYFPQPKTFEVQTNDGEIFDYTPDFEVVSDCEQITYIEVKPKDHLLDKKIEQRIHDSDRFISRMGHGFRLVTDEEIYEFPRFCNLERLYRYRHRNNIDFQKVEKLKKLISEKVVFKSLINQNILSIKEAYTWVANGILKFDLDKEVFTMESEVWINEA